jgi:hypothetical protein
MHLTKETILAADDLPLQEVSVPEWGGHVWVRTMRAVERDAFEVAAMNGDGVNRENFRARLAVATLVDDDGTLLFGASDMDALGKKSAAALDRVMGVAMRLNGLSKDDVEDLVGNSEPGQSDDSSSA